MTRIKLCGVTNEEDLQAVAAAGADAVGLITGVADTSPRSISPGAAARLARASGPFLSTVLVTMPESVSDVTRLTERVRPDVVQIHGVDVELAAAIEREVASLIVAADVTEATRFGGVADAILVDSVDASGAGGTGETTDWSRARGLVERLSTPVILAGGLTPENVATGIERVQPYAVDVASGIEASDGRKDHQKLRSFVHNADTASGRVGRASR
jgi:phosphoribosylanthranilate isomerase